MDRTGLSSLFLVFKILLAIVVYLRFHTYFTISFSCPMEDCFRFWNGVPSNLEIIWEKIKTLNAKFFHPLTYLLYIKAHILKVLFWSVVSKNCKYLLLSSFIWCIIVVFYIVNRIIFQLYFQIAYYWHTEKIGRYLYMLSLYSAT